MSVALNLGRKVIRRGKPKPDPEPRNLRDLSVDEIEALIDATARDLLNVSGSEALRMLDAGELDGTTAGESIRSLRWLRAA